jgi:hypothetical protein
MDSKVGAVDIKNREAGLADKSKVGEDLVEKEEEGFLRVMKYV